MNITVFQAVFGGISLVLASVGGAWASSSAAANKELSNFNTELQVVKTTEMLHYTEVKELLIGIKEQVDKIAPPTVLKNLNAKNAN